MNFSQAAPSLTRVNVKENLLFIKDLSIYHLNKLKVIDSLNLLIKRAETFCLVGESGSGKTMTALAIMRLLPEGMSCSGRIIYKDRDLLTLSQEEMRRLRGKEIAMIFQEPMTSLNPVLTIGYQVSEMLVTHMGLSKKEALKESVKLLKKVNIPSPEERLRSYPHQLSGGLRQRVMIAMAIACRPELLIADEPTTALDVTIQAQILDLLDMLKEEYGLTVLLITHDLGIVRQHSDRVGVMYAGSLMEIAETERLFNSPLHPYTIGLIRSLPEIKGMDLKPIPGSIPTIRELPEGCRFQDRCERVIQECREAEPELREIEKGHFVRCLRV
ncbi:MAG: ABC transporter ATP-binding protein [Thermodesulfovibrionales bacterium]|nr:ABC transporter ATP-binding protein [Thermodesulfovibrionales bacterium]